jgi:hypothetical protein
VSDDNDEPLTEIEKVTLLLLEQMKKAKDESDRGYVLFIAAQADAFLQEIISGFLIADKSVKNLFDGQYAPFESLSAKTHAAYLLGLITKSEADRVDALRKVRNVFAHSIDGTFSNPKVVKLCGKSPIFDGRLTDRDAFLHMAMNVVFPLAYRSVEVRTKWRRVELTNADVHKA